MEAIQRRIVQAHSSGQKFRVIIVLPQKPEFSGEYFSKLSRNVALMYRLKNIKCSMIDLLWDFNMAGMIAMCKMKEDQHSLVETLQ